MSVDPYDSETIDSAGETAHRAHVRATAPPENDRALGKHRCQLTRLFGE